MACHQQIGQTYALPGVPGGRTPDYIIIGGGSAGCVLAAACPKTPLSTWPCSKRAFDSSVLIHCPAGLACHGQVQHGRLGAEHGAAARAERPRGYQPRGKVLGGSSSVNAMVYIRGQPSRLRPLGRRRATPAGLGRCAALLQARRTQRARRPTPARQGGPLNVMDLRAPTALASVCAGRRAGGLPAQPGLQRRQTRKAWACTRSPTRMANATAPPRPT
jgi:choline dehydrogenase-like flavoprotein